MNDIGIELLTYFVIYSFAGWILESCFRSLCEKKIINSGFLKGPFCPIYGVGAIIMYVFLDSFQDQIILLFFTSLVVLTVWEYVVGIYLEKVFHTKYWDYSDHKFNFQGRICLTNSIYWGILGVVFVRYIHPFVQMKMVLINPRYLVLAIYVLSIIIIADAVQSIIKLKNIKATLQKVEQLNVQLKEKLEEFKDLSADKAKFEVAENIQMVVHQLELKKNRIIRRLYKQVHRLKKAFPAINSKEITEVLNKKVELKIIKGKQKGLEEEKQTKE